MIPTDKAAMPPHICNGGATADAGAEAGAGDGDDAGKLASLARLARDTGRYHVETTARSICIRPARNRGFPVSLRVEDDGCIASIGGLIHEFDDIDEALPWLRGCLTGDCRLRIEKRGGSAHTWTLQLRAPRHGTWIDGLSSGYVRILPDWLAGPSSVEYYFNEPATTTPA